MADILCLSNDDVFDQIVPDPEDTLELQLDDVERDCLSIKNYTNPATARSTASDVSQVITCRIYIIINVFVF